MRPAEPRPGLAPMARALPPPPWTVPLAWFLALVFAATGLGKALDVVGFALILQDYRLFPDALLMPLALGIILLEFAIAVGLLQSATRAMATRAAMLLAAGNALALGVTLWRGIALANCGCFGVFWPRPLTILSPLEDVVLILLAWLVWRGARE